MIDNAAEILRYILTLLFGVFASSSFLNVRITRKNVLILFGFSAIDLILQGFFLYSRGMASVTALYPLIAHLPLLLLFTLVFRKKPISSVFAVTVVYLCCQTCNWVSAMPEAFGAPQWTVHLTYSFTLVIMFFLALRFLSPAVTNLLQKPGRPLVFFCIVPVFYYIFDYTATVYTKLLYTGDRISTEFVPFLLCVCYLTFCVVYFKQYEEKQEIENRNRLMRIRQEQSEKKIETLRRSEKAISLLRHDMRHFLSNISAYIGEGEYEKAQEYIHNIIESADKTVNRRYCTNDTVNMILSSYADVIEENRIRFRYTIHIPKELPFSDVDITSILSNALENAIHAVLSLDAERRLIELSITEKSGKILISCANPYAVRPRMADGLPVSENNGHGLGTQSILYATEKLKGKCQFSMTDERFLLQIVI